jgi:hypothetical protein
MSGGGYNPPYAAMVVDVKTGRTLHAENEDALRHPASVTKVMTLYLLFEQLERGKLALDTPADGLRQRRRQAPSKLGLRPGETIEVEDAIKALVTKSANDVAVVVAENLGGSEEAFAEQMTRKARSLGMSRTVYRNASGLPDPSRSRRRGTSRSSARAIQDRFPRYYRYFQTRVFNYAGRSHGNHNKLLGRVEGVDGIKTGFTRASGFNLMTNAKTDDRHIVAVVLGGRSGASRDQIMASSCARTCPAPLPALVRRRRSAKAPGPWPPPSPPGSGAARAPRSPHSGRAGCAGAAPRGRRGHHSRDRNAGSPQAARSHQPPARGRLRGGRQLDHDAVVPVAGAAGKPLCPSTPTPTRPWRRSSRCVRLRRRSRPLALLRPCRPPSSRIASRRNPGPRSCPGSRRGGSAEGRARSRGGARDAPRRSGFGLGDPARRHGRRGPRRRPCSTRPSPAPAGRSRARPPFTEKVTATARPSTGPASRASTEADDGAGCLQDAQAQRLLLLRDAQLNRASGGACSAPPSTSSPAGSRVEYQRCRLSRISLASLTRAAKVRRAPLVGMEFLHQRPVRPADLVGARPRLKAQDLVGFLFRHRARARLSARPRVRLAERLHASRQTGGRDTPLGAAPRRGPAAALLRRGPERRLVEARRAAAREAPASTVPSMAPVS